MITQIPTREALLQKALNVALSDISALKKQFANKQKLTPAQVSSMKKLIIQLLHESLQEQESSAAQNTDFSLPEKVLEIKNLLQEDIIYSDDDHPVIQTLDSLDLNSSGPSNPYAEQVIIQQQFPEIAERLVLLLSRYNFISY